MDIPLVGYPFTRRWTLGFLYLLAMANCAAVNVHARAFVRTSISHSFGVIILRSGIEGSYGNSVFKFLRTAQSNRHVSPECMLLDHKTFRKRMCRNEKVQITQSDLKIINFLNISHQDFRECLNRCILVSTPSIKIFFTKTVVPFGATSSGASLSKIATSALPPPRPSLFSLALSPPSVLSLPCSSQTPRMRAELSVLFPPLYTR